MQLDNFLNVVQELEKEPRSTVKLQLLETYFKTLTNKERQTLVWLIENNDFKKQLKLSDKSVIKAIDPENIISNSVDAEDHVQKTEGTKFVTAQQLINFMTQLAEFHGSGSQKRKYLYLTTFFKDLSSEIIKLIIRLMLNKLRCGVSSKLLLRAFAKVSNISYAEALHNYSYVKQLNLESVTNYELNFEKMVIRPMLCKPGDDKVLKKVNLTEYCFEYKLDGFRLIIYCNKGIVRAHTRNLQTLSHLNKFLKATLKVKPEDSFIFDAEVVGNNFQQLSRIIMRKVNINQQMFEAVTIRIFDVLYLKQFLFDKPYCHRKKLLKSFLNARNLNALYIKSFKIGRNLSDILQTSQVLNLEGVILKQKYSFYEPNKRNDCWLKLKPDFKEADLLVVGVNKGAGSKKDYYSSVIVACKNATNLVNLGEVGSGYKLEDLKQLKKYWDAQKTIIIEVKYQDVQTTNETHSLRFPVFKRFRLDKSIDDITTLKEILKK